MKFAITAVFAIMSCVGFAQSVPKVGDKILIEHKIKLADSDVTYIGEMTYSIEAYDANTDQYLVSDWIFPDYWETRKILETLFYVQDLAKHCSERPSGRIERIEVPAGSFNACRAEYKYEGHTEIRWTSNEVPFGMVKTIWLRSDGGITEETLLEFTIGQ